MGKSIYENYRILKSHAYNSYWEKRILAEIGYLIELLYDTDENAEVLLTQAISLLEKEYTENGQLGKVAVQNTEELLMPLSPKAKDNTVICAAHAHIDMNWMWGYQETVAVTLDTMRTMLTLMEEYSDFHFSQSQASVYHILEKYAPDLLAQIKKRVHEGRFEITASTWVENDKNMSGGEAMSRHLLYTKRYLAGLFNIEESSLNLDFEPDTFGHSYNLPEILSAGGVSRYYHCRGYDGENLYRWKGLSGAEVLVCREPSWYNNTIDSDLCEGLVPYMEQYGLKKTLRVYGVGDHGGGPTRRDLDRLVDMGSWPLYPQIKFGTFREFFDYLESKKDSFPVVEQELNYVFTGCYTSQSRIKMANRIGENRLYETECLSSMAKLEVAGYQPIGKMEAAWRKILFNQFHDILPGSGTVETREYAMGQFQEAMAIAGGEGSHAMNALCSNIAKTDGIDEKWREDVSIYNGPMRERDTAMGAGVGSGTDYAGTFGFTQSERGFGNVRYMMLFNVVQEDRTDATEITLWDWKEDEKNTKVSDLKDQEYPFQIIETGNGYWGHTYCKMLVWMPVPALGHNVCKISVRAADRIYSQKDNNPRIDDFTDEPVCIENERIKALFDVDTMKCISLLDKESGKEMLNGNNPACGLVLFTEENSNSMTSWRVGRLTRKYDLNEQACVKLLNIQLQGLHKQLEYELSGIEGIKARVRIGLDQGSPLLKFDLNIAWTLTGSEAKGIPQLRFMLPCGGEKGKYRYAIPCGLIDRAPLAQDVPALGLGCVITDTENDTMGQKKLCLLSDSKYGFRGDRDGLSLNLIRASYDPDPYPENGDHKIHVAVGISNPEPEMLIKTMEHYLHPVIGYSCGVRPDPERTGKSLLQVEGAVLSAWKEAEDGEGFIIRVYNVCSSPQTLKMSMPKCKVWAYGCDTLENNLYRISDTTVETVLYEMKGNGIYSFRLIPCL